jgi:lipoprotein-anchoring transpeptidase ErfK/SrfK
VQAPHPAGPSRAQKSPRRATTSKLPCGTPLAFQVLLDRQGFSPGQIDGSVGPNLQHAIAAFQQARQLPSTGQADCDAWRALGGDSAGAVLDTYTITAADARGPFTKCIPDNLLAQARLRALGYRSVLEALGERFHADPDLLRRLNRRSRFSAGSHIRVPAVAPFDAAVKPTHDPTMSDVTITVSRDESALRATRPDGTLVFFAPVSSGSIHDPLPPGEWMVTSVDWMPAFHYNPKLFWDAKGSDGKATIKPGPNGPVGVVWIGLDLEHYGLHGTAEPGHIGRTESHGCVRLTNWDAARVAAIVDKGTRVVFR